MQLGDNGVNCTTPSDQSILWITIRLFETYPQHFLKVHFAFEPPTTRHLVLALPHFLKCAQALWINGLADYNR